jgi:hypothetical protein
MNGRARNRLPCLPAIGLATAVLAGLALFATRAPADPVTVTRVSFDGWADCIRIANGTVEAIVVPANGRIMAFRLIGDRASDPLYVNADIAGKPGGGAGWVNFGGSKVWPSPQSAWQDYIGRTWPPDPAIDGSPYQVSVIRGGVRMQSRASSAFGLRIERTITMPPRGARLRIAEGIRWLSKPKATGARLGVWTVTQTRPDSTIFLPMGSGGRSAPAGYVTFTDLRHPDAGTPTLPAQWRRCGRVLVGRRDARDCHKVGSPDPADWIASLYAGNTVFVQRFAEGAGGRSQPDRGCRAEVFTMVGKDGYMEMELLAPLTARRIGGLAKLRVEWILSRLPNAPAGDAEAAAEIERINARK